MLTVAGLSSGAFDGGLHYLEILNDTNGADGVDTEGLVLDIASNTDTSITIVGDLTGVNGDEAVLVRKHVTLVELFPDATGFSAGGTDSLTLYTESGPITYIYFMGDFFLSGVGTPSNDVVVYPGTSVVLNTSGSVTFTTYGSVKVTPTQVPIYGGVVNLVGYIQPVGPIDITGADYTAGFDTGTAALTTYVNNAGVFSPTGTYIAFQGDLYDGGGLVGSVLIDEEDGVVLNVPNDAVIKVPAVSVSP